MAMNKEPQTTIEELKKALTYFTSYFEVRPCVRKIGTTGMCLDEKETDVADELALWAKIGGGEYLMVMSGNSYMQANLNMLGGALENARRLLND
jgi:hypothetical protein